MQLLFTQEEERLFSTPSSTIQPRKDYDNSCELDGKVEDQLNGCSASQQEQKKSENLTGDVQLNSAVETSEECQQYLPSVLHSDHTCDHPVSTR
jgi:hypothetical protein